MNAMETGPPKISVYIPTYNVAQFLPRCMKSLLAQELPADEILVIDDGSGDNSAELAAACLDGETAPAVVVDSAGTGDWPTCWSLMTASWAVRWPRT